MKQVILAVIGIVLFAQNTYSQERSKQNKVLIVYFSVTKNTAEPAEKIASVTGGELYEIVPQTPYTRADLNWSDKQSRSSREMSDPKSRPAIKGKKINTNNQKE